MAQPLDPDILRHYEVAGERSRLTANAAGRLEFERTRELLGRWLPERPARILDVGGGPGGHAVWLAADGHEVELLDPVALHVEQARAAAAAAPRGFSARVGDARALPVADATVDVVLLLGPLYHLDAAGRAVALAEAARVLRPGGLLAAAAISRYASLLDGLASGSLGEDEFASMVRHALATGEHRNPDPVGRPAWFTTAWFHRPAELRAELAHAGLAVEAVLAVEGPAWLLQDLDRRWNDGTERDRLLEAIRLVEAEDSLLGASAHLLAAARRPGGRPEGCADA